MRNYIQEFEFEDMQLEDKIEVSFVNMLWEINLKMENVIQLEILTVDNDRWTLVETFWIIFQNEAFKFHFHYEVSFMF